MIRYRLILTRYFTWQIGAIWNELDILGAVASQALSLRGYISKGPFHLKTWNNFPVEFSAENVPSFQLFKQNILLNQFNSALSSDENQTLISMSTNLGSLQPKKIVLSLTAPQCSDISKYYGGVDRCANWASSSCSTVDSIAVPLFTARNKNPKNSDCEMSWLVYSSVLLRESIIEIKHFISAMPLCHACFFSQLISKVTDQGYHDDVKYLHQRCPVTRLNHFDP